MGEHQDSQLRKDVTRIAQTIAQRREAIDPQQPGTGYNFTVGDSAVMMRSLVVAKVHKRPWMEKTVQDRSQGQAGIISGSQPARHVRAFFYANG